MKILPVSNKMTKTAMPARLGEIDGIVHPMPIPLCNEAKEEYPVYDSQKVETMIVYDNFLKFVFAELGEGEDSLMQIFNTFVLEDDSYCKQYNGMS